MKIIVAKSIVPQNSELWYTESNQHCPSRMIGVNGAVYLQCWESLCLQTTNPIHSEYERLSINTLPQLCSYKPKRESSVPGLRASSETAKPMSLAVGCLTSRTEVQGYSGNTRSKLEATTEGTGNSWTGKANPDASKGSPHQCDISMRN